MAVWTVVEHSRMTRQNFKFYNKKICYFVECNCLTITYCIVKQKFCIMYNLLFVWYYQCYMLVTGSYFFPIILLFLKKRCYYSLIVQYWIIWSDSDSTLFANNRSPDYFLILCEEFCFLLYKMNFMSNENIAKFQPIKISSSQTLVMAIRYIYSIALKFAPFTT